MSNIIETKNLTFAYSKDDPLIKNLNLQIPEKSIYGFLGPNGAGKTTTIRLILGLLHKCTGEISLLGKELENNKMEIFSNIGALVEDAVFYQQLTGFENLKLFSKYRGIKNERIKEVLEIVKLTNASDKQVKKYSTGMKQRLGLALALLPDPELLILDEPTNGLDPKGIIEIRELLVDLNKNFNKTILLSSHLLSEIEKICSNVGIINKGEMIYQGTVKNLKEQMMANLLVEFETNDNVRSAEVIQKFKEGEIIGVNGKVLINIESRSQISNLIDYIRNNDIEIYTVNIVNNLENLFIKLTD